MRAFDPTTATMDELIVRLARWAFYSQHRWRSFVGAELLRRLHADVTHPLVRIALDSECSLPRRRNALRGLARLGMPLRSDEYNQVELLRISGPESIRPLAGRVVRAIRVVQVHADGLAAW